MQLKSQKALRYKIHNHKIMENSQLALQIDNTKTNN